MHSNYSYDEYITNIFMYEVVIIHDEICSATTMQPQPVVQTNGRPRSRVILPCFGFDGWRNGPSMSVCKLHMLQ